MAGKRGIKRRNGRPRRANLRVDSGPWTQEFALNVDMNRTLSPPDARDSEPGPVVEFQLFSCAAGASGDAHMIGLSEPYWQLLHIDSSAFGNSNFFSKPLLAL